MARGEDFGAESKLLHVEAAHLLACHHEGNVGQAGQPARSQDDVAVLAGQVYETAEMVPHAG